MTSFRRYPEYVNLEDSSKKLREVFNKLRYGRALQNKYLYLESSGAYNWAHVERKLGLAVNEETLVDEHFNNIDSIIRDQSNCKSYDIISLGCGSGTDDMAIINFVYAKMAENFSITTIDLSFNLLVKGTSQIHSKISEKNINDKVDILGICCDFENLENAKSYLETRRRNKVRLFHLLGLTIGNNFEIQLLRKITDIMDEEDYLLISVDLSAEDDKALKNSAKAYNSGEESILVDKFLLGPLNMSMNFHVNKRNREPFLYTKICPNINGERDNQSTEIDYLVNGYLPLLIKSKEEGGLNQYSNIEDTVTFTRYYQFGDHKVLCDYSNKYKFDPFNKFIFNLYGLGIYLEPVEGVLDFGIRDDLMAKCDPFQYLVLLKKTDPAQHENYVNSISEEIKNYLVYTEDTNLDVEVYNNLKESGVYEYIVDQNIHILRTIISKLSLSKIKKIQPPPTNEHNNKKKYKEFSDNIIELIVSNTT